MDISRIARAMQRFTGTALTATLSRIENEIEGITAERCAAFLSASGAERDALVAAAHLKRIASQVNVTIHALGILLCLPHILEPDEAIQYVSLGAGNTGRQFDLETNRRIAEFKFIRWQGGPETIRQNSLFKDFMLLAEHRTEKSRYLYVLGVEHPLRFLRGRRAMNSVLSHVGLKERFVRIYGARFETVGEYFKAQKSKVSIEDVAPWLPELIAEEAEPP